MRGGGPFIGDATTFKSILNENGKGGEVLGLVVGYSGEASSDVYRVVDLVATLLASKYLEYIRSSASIAKAMQTQRICCAWGHSFAREIFPPLFRPFFVPEVVSFPFVKPFCAF
jgi:hypothetical protein